MKKVKMTFEVIVDKDPMISDEEMKEDFDNDIHKVCKYLYNEEGIWWDEEMKLVKTEII